MRLSFQIFKPDIKGTVADQAESCINQLDEYIRYNKQQVIALTVFVKAEKLILLEQKQVIFEHLIKDKYNKTLPIAFVAEPPVTNFDFVVEAHTVSDDLNGFELKYKGDDEFTYIVLKHEEKGTFLFVSGISDYIKRGDVSQSSDEVFTRMATYLKCEGMNMSHIYRQWNYIEGIVETKDENSLLTQNYQEFNDVRAKWYGKYDFTKGYPAATGIGTKTGGICVSFFAYKGPAEKGIKSVINPLQTEAFEYSEDVLVGDILENEYCKSTPKFDRAKYINLFDNELIFVSGTASIRGEETLAIDNPQEQTHITIQNMIELLKSESLKISKIDTKVEGFQMLYIRIYVKTACDLNSIKGVCDLYFPNIPKAYVIADVCRDNLLVEIEGVAEAI